MKIGHHDTSEKTFIIAEIGNNHEGSVEVAKEMICEAAKSGVDAVKFQTFQTENYVTEENIERCKRLRQFELSFEEFTQLSKTAADEGVQFISTPFDLNSAEFLNSIVPAFKISSSDNVFFPLLEKVSSFGKPILLSTGMLSCDSIQESVSFINKCQEAQGVSSELGILHCVTSYPVSPENANLTAISDIISKFPEYTVGYSDHTLGKLASVSSVALGARVLEKHFTLDKNYSDFRDHQISACPKEMASIVKEVRELEAMLGNGEKKIEACEVDMLPPMRRSIRLKKDLSAGAVLTIDDIKWVRPGGGLPPGSEEKIIGKTLTRDLAKESLLEEGHFA